MEPEGQMAPGSEWAPKEQARLDMDAAEQFLKDKDTKTNNTIEERGKVYGDPLQTHINIGLVWTGLLQHHYGITLHHTVPPELAAQMMVVLKMVRATKGYHEDNYVDARAYAGFAENFQQRSIHEPKDPA